jgi:hypothetical protein
MCTHMTQCKWTASEMRLTLSAIKNAAQQCVISHTKYSDSESTVILKNTHLLLTCILQEQYFI